ncbi:M42 family metallopeptidase [Membranihabitans maritimus]|uniref:M42 family metallopeptidase n=1 Tax=Membranihabitans maritimus TaxID=2904244 RepID=UPI001F3B498B|nr:M42 family metallopeptidase [Membranihabitans maritimus]
MIWDEKSTSFLEKYINNSSPTGREESGQKLWRDYISEYVDQIDLDNYGTTFGIINPGQEQRIVIEAHADEISWFVNYISKDGFIYVVRNGGSDHEIAPGKRVNIHTKNGIVRGLFGWPAIHTRKGKNNSKPEIEKLFIDVGAKDKEEVLSMGIHVGCIITYPDTLELMNEKYYVGRALDNRMGGFCIAQVARLLQKNNIQLPYSLYIVNAVQEEIGLRGAQMIAEKIKPHAAIITDVTHDTTTPMIDSKKYGDVQCGKGPSLTYGPAVHYKLLDLIIDTAEENNIPIQREAASRSTGTDTDAFAYSNEGVPSALISLPLRYMHTTVETAHKDDIEHVIHLIYHSLRKIESNHNFRYF